MSSDRSRREADRLWTYSSWIYGGLAAFLMAYGTWILITAVWSLGSVPARAALVGGLTLAVTLAARDLRRRRLGIFTGSVWAIWVILTLLVILFGDLYFLVTQP